MLLFIVVVSKWLNVTVVRVRFFPLLRHEWQQKHMDVTLHAATVL